MNDELARGWPAARALFATEARLLVRDRRTLFTALVLPLLVLPLMFGLMSWSNVQREERVESREYLWAVSGDAAALATTLFEAGEAASAEPIADDASTAPEIELRRIEVEDPEAALRAGELAVWVEALGVEAARQRLAEERAAAESEQRSESVAEAANGDGASVAEPAAVPNLRIHLIGNRDASSTAAGALRERLDRARLERRAEAFEAAGLGTAEQDVAAIVERRDLAGPDARRGARTGRGAALFL
ncbi:MAG: hypothetical protein AAGN46_17295, partial [Acidobacteriota bacterium]